MMTEPYINKLTIDLLLDSLSAEDRDLVVLYFIEGYTIKEIVKIMRKRYKHKADARETGVKIAEIIRKLRKDAGIKGTYNIIRQRKTKSRQNEME